MPQLKPSCCQVWVVSAALLVLCCWWCRWCFHQRMKAKSPLPQCSCLQQWHTSSLQLMRDAEA